jgi:hypothetical protein
MSANVCIVCSSYGGDCRLTPRQLKTAVRTRALFPQLKTNMITDALQSVDAEHGRQLAAIPDAWAGLTTASPDRCGASAR